MSGSVVSPRRAVRSAQPQRCYFVQATSPREARPGPRASWVTIASASQRGVALEYAAEVYRMTDRPLGRVPARVRVMSEAALRFEGGDQLVAQAFRDLAQLADGGPAASGD